jgi:hypothetical protein
MVSGWSLWSALAAASRLAYPGWLVQTMDALFLPLRKINRRKLGGGWHLS